MVNSVSTAKFGTTSRKIIKDNKPCVNKKGQLYWPKIDSTAKSNDAQININYPNIGVGLVFQSRA